MHPAPLSGSAEPPLAHERPRAEAALGLGSASHQRRAEPGRQPEEPPQKRWLIRQQSDGADARPSEISDGAASMSKRAREEADQAKRLADHWRARALEFRRLATGSERSMFKRAAEQAS